MVWTVGELIKELERFDEDTDVVVETFEGDAYIERVNKVGEYIVIKPN